MKLSGFLKDFFGSRDVINISEHLESATTNFAIDSFTYMVGVNLISKTISKCEFKTFINGKEKKSDEYFLWNMQPNLNQNSNEFIIQLVSKLLVENEVLVIDSGGQLLIADSFTRDEYALKEDIFKGVTVKNFQFNKSFLMSDVLYFKLNNSNIKEYLDTLVSDYNNLLELATGKYKRSGGRKGVAKLDSLEKGNEEQKKAKRKLISNMFKDYFEKENAVLTLNKGEEYIESTSPSNKKNNSELNDIRNLINDATTSVGQALSIPIGLLKGDLTEIDSVTNNFLTFCIEPIVKLLETEINRKRYGKQTLKGSCIKIDSSTIKQKGLFEVAEACDKLLADGMYCIDDLRIKLGDSALNTDFSKKHFLTKNYQDINTGGD